MDAVGDLFGTTFAGGANNDGTVFEVPQTGAGYAATPTILVSFNGTPNGSNPAAGLIADAAGDFNRDGYSAILWQNTTNGAVAIWEMKGAKVIASASVGNPGVTWHVIGSGDFNGDGYSDILWQNANGAIAIWEMDGMNVIASHGIDGPGISWHAIGTQPRRVNPGDARCCPRNAGQNQAGRGGVQVIEAVAGRKGLGRIRRTGRGGARRAPAQVRLDVGNGGHGVGPALLSRAQVCLAPSIWRRLLMQARLLGFALARMKLGMAMVASRPMMATTIMISTNVKPEFGRT